MHVYICLTWVICNSDLRLSHDSDLRLGLFATGTSPVTTNIYKPFGLPENRRILPVEYGLSWDKHAFLHRLNHTVMLRS